MLTHDEAADLKNKLAAVRLCAQTLQRDCQRGDTSRLSDALGRLVDVIDRATGYVYELEGVAERDREWVIA